MTLTSVTTRKGTDTVVSFTYTRDAMGRIVKVDADRLEASWSYAYDALGRLTSALNAADVVSATKRSRSYAYDAGGNMTDAEYKPGAALQDYPTEQVGDLSRGRFLSRYHGLKPGTSIGLGNVILEDKQYAPYFD